MRNISFTRIKHLWIQTAVVSKKQLLFNLLGITCGLFMINLGASKSMDSINLLSASYFLIFCVMLSISLSNTFRQMQTKEGRIAFLTLPASPAEKFIANVVWAVVVPVILFFVSAVCIDLLRIVYLTCIGKNDTGMLLPLIFQNYSVATLQFGSYQTSGILIWSLFHVFSFTIFLLGSCIWYKKVFLKTIAAIGICTFILMFVLMLGIQSVQDWILPHEIEIWLRSIDTSTIITVINIFGILCTVILWWISYRLFKRREVISQKRSWFGWLKK